MWQPFVDFSYIYYSLIIYTTQDNSQDVYQDANKKLESLCEAVNWKICVSETNITKNRVEEYTSITN